MFIGDFEANERERGELLRVALSYVPNMVDIYRKYRAKLLLLSESVRSTSKSRRQTGLQKLIINLTNSTSKQQTFEDCKHW